MRMFGLEFTVRKAAPSSLASVADNRGGWWPWIREPYVGAWQRGDEWSVDTVLAHHAVFACITLIASDVGKLRPKLVRLNMETGIWEEIASREFGNVLKRPNHFQNHIQFKENWITSKLTHGNTYVLKERREGRVVRLYILDPSRVQVMVGPGGEVFYKLHQDNLSGIDGESAVMVPASEVIHDRINCLFHPLVGVSPLFASGQAAQLGIHAEANAASFFANGSNPSGILATAVPVTDEKILERAKQQWESGFTGTNSGRVAVLGASFSYTQLRMSAVDSQMIEHLKWTAEVVCSAFHVPAFKVGVGQMPTYQNGETLNQIYYSDCLQSHIEAMEVCLDEGLDLMQYGTLGVELDLDGLLRMDTATQVKTLTEGILGGLYKPDEARKKMDLVPVPGGDAVYLQQQNFSLAALSKRDSKADPFATSTGTQSPSAPSAPTPRAPNPDDVVTKVPPEEWNNYEQWAAWFDEDAKELAVELTLGVGQ
jgi:HK97 family phage portal protein